MIRVDGLSFLDVETFGNFTCGRNCQALPYTASVVGYRDSHSVMFKKGMDKDRRKELKSPSSITQFMLYHGGQQEKR